MKQPIRYFSIGLLTASLIIFIIVSFFDKPDNQVNEGSVDEMISALKDEGYHVLSSSEYISLSVATETQGNDDAEIDENENSTIDDGSNEAQVETEDADNTEIEEVEEIDDVYEYTLTIEPNMLGPTISNLLEDNNIIDNADDFNRYLETEGYAPYLQLGDHDVSSDMSHYEIAETIARSR